MRVCVGIPLATDKGIPSVYDFGAASLVLAIFLNNKMRKK